MKQFFLIFVLVVILFSHLSFAARAHDEGLLLVKLKDLVDPNFLKKYSLETRPLFDQIYRIRVSRSQLVKSILSAHQSVLFVEEDQVLHTTLNVSDPKFVLDETEISGQWYLPKIKTHLAWDKTIGHGITVAVIDTGIDGKHEDLSDGRVVKGYLSYCQVTGRSANDCLIHVSGELSAGTNSDDNGHGTIVAGIIGAISNNSRGIAGINWNVKLMPIKALDANGSGLASDVAIGIRWATDNGAKIVNLSIGGPGLDGIQVLQEAISYAFNRGVLVVAAAGNDAAVSGGNLNTNPVLPVCADGGQNMVIGVAAVDINDRKARFSNYGSNCIDLVAPGTATFIDRQQKQGLISTYYDPTRPGDQNLYVYAVGTSLAAPMASGVAALMMGAFPDLDVRAIRDRLLTSVDNIDAANDTGCDGSCVGQIGKGRINALKAVSQTPVLQSSGLISSPEGIVYLLERGVKHPVSAFVQRQRFAGLEVVPLTSEQIQAYPQGEPVSPSDGTLIKEPSQPIVYLVEGGRRRGLSYLSFISRGFRFSEIVVLPEAEVRNYPLGDDAPIIGGVLIKAPNHPAVFVLSSGVRQLLSFFVFQQRGFQNSLIGVFSLEELAVYPIHSQEFLYPPLEGTLIRGTDSQTVYLIQNAKRHGLNLAVFQNRGYNFADVKTLPQSEVDGYELGEDILQ